jgi:hypothetical protein
MTELAQLERATEFATTAHRGQVDLAGKPYLGHLLRVAMRCADDPAAQMVALLHDVLEDTLTTPAQLRQAGFGLEVTEAVTVLTKHDGERYWDYIRHVGCNPLATRVKLADLRDNLNLRRLPKLHYADLKRALKYLGALLYLEWRYTWQLTFPTHS